MNEGSRNILLVENNPKETNAPCRPPVCHRLCVADFATMAFETARAGRQPDTQRGLSSLAARGVAGRAACDPSST
jgi:hypothetical protein